MVTDEVPANLFDATCAQPICPRSVIYIAYGAKQRLSDAAANSCAL